jgi:hypothetical protein
MTKIIAYPVMLLAGAGIVLCLAFYLLGVTRLYLLPSNREPVLFIGIFVVWFPTVILMNQLTKDFKQKDVWKAALRGCPPWMKTGMWVLVGCVFVLFFLSNIRVHSPENSSFVFVLFPITFYSISFCAMYSLIHVEEFDNSRRCLNGHRISPLAKFCEECGAPAAPDCKTSVPI